MNELKPRFKHDCASCRFLGHLDGSDAYECTTSLVLRKSDDGPDYISVAKLSEIKSEQLRIVERMSK